MPVRVIRWRRVYGTRTPTSITGSTRGESACPWGIWSRDPLPMPFPYPTCASAPAAGTPPQSLVGIDYGPSRSASRPGHVSGPSWRSDGTPAAVSFLIVRVVPAAPASRVTTGQSNSDQQYLPAKHTRCGTEAPGRRLHEHANVATIRPSLRFSQLLRHCPFSALGATEPYPPAGDLSLVLGCLAFWLVVEGLEENFGNALGRGKGPDARHRDLSEAISRLRLNPGRSSRGKCPTPCQPCGGPRSGEAHALNCVLISNPP